MAVIENFAALSEKEQREFAEALIKTINSESTFTNDTNFVIIDVEASELTGNLEIDIDHEKPIEVRREATWTCASEEDMRDDPGYDADYDDSIFDDAKKALKTFSAIIDGYKVSLVFHDVDEEETVDVEVDSYSHEDNGIGDYEFWGQTGHDSQPYVEVFGTITKACNYVLSLHVEPADDPVEAAEPAAE